MGRLDWLMVAGFATFVACSNDNQLGVSAGAEASASGRAGEGGEPEGVGGGSTAGLGGGSDGGAGNAAGSGGTGHVPGSGGLGQAAGADAGNATASGGAGDATGAGGAGNAGGENDAGPVLECTVSADCPQTGHPCLQLDCQDGLCRSTDVCSTDDAGSTCAGEICQSTRCAGVECGPAVCCATERGTACLRGESVCPAPETPDQALLKCPGRPLGVVLSKSCEQTNDCFIALHWRGCCSLDAIGLNVAERPLFDWFTPNCGGPPACGCCCDFTLADDGQSIEGTDPAAFAVECVSGICQTRLR